MAIVAGFWYIAQRLPQPKKLLTALGIESLFIYMLHLILLYGSVLNSNLNLQVILGNNLNLLQTSITFFAFFILMLASAILWNNLKEHHQNVYRVIQIVGSGIFLFFFFTREY